jgi:hypothetical protein
MMLSQLKMWQTSSKVNFVVLPANLDSQGLVFS